MLFPLYELFGIYSITIILRVEVTPDIFLNANISLFSSSWEDDSIDTMKSYLPYIACDSITPLVLFSSSFTLSSYPDFTFNKMKALFTIMNNFHPN